MTDDENCEQIEHAIQKVREGEDVAITIHMPAFFACPRCGAISHNPNDVAEGYCGNCAV